MQNNEDPEVRRKRIARRVKIGLAAIVCLIVSPVIFSVIKGMVGLCIAGLIGTVAVQFAPVVSMKIANWRMKMIKSEAENNPIETMENVFLEKAEAIQLGDQRIVQFQGRLADYLDKLEAFKERHPNRAAKFEDIAGTMKRGLKKMKEKQITAKKKQAEYQAKIEEAKAIYDMAKAARSVSELSADVERQVFQDIKQQVAFDSVTREFNEAVAELSLEVENDRDFIDVTPVEEGSELKQLPAVMSDDKLEFETTKEKAKVRR